MKTKKEKDNNALFFPSPRLHEVLRTQNRSARSAATAAFPATVPLRSAPATVRLAQLWAEGLTRSVSGNVHSPWRCWGPRIVMLATQASAHRLPAPSANGGADSLKGFKYFRRSDSLDCQAEKQTAVPQNSCPWAPAANPQEAGWALQQPLGWTQVLPWNSGATRPGRGLARPPASGKARGLC